VLTVLPGGDELREFLDRLNEEGVTPEAAGIDAGGVVFLAALTDPDGSLAYHVTTERGTVACPECDLDSDTRDWLPRFPVTVLSDERAS